MGVCSESVSDPLFFQMPADVIHKATLHASRRANQEGETASMPVLRSYTTQGNKRAVELIL